VHKLRQELARVKGKTGWLTTVEELQRTRQAAGWRAAATGLSYKTTPRVLREQSPCTCLSLFIVHVSTNKLVSQLTSTKPEVDKDLCVRVSLACTYHTLACTYPCARARHLPARAMPMPARALCSPCLFSFHTLDGYSATEQYFNGECFQQSAYSPTRTPGSGTNNSGRVIYGQNLTFCYLFFVHKSLSVTVQKNIPQGFCTEKIPCQTNFMVHDNIGFTTRFFSEISTNKSSDFPHIFRKHKSLCGKVKNMRNSRKSWTYCTNSTDYKEILICAEDQTEWISWIFVFILHELDSCSNICINRL